MNDVFREITRDEEVYPDAESFRLERFLKAPERRHNGVYFRFRTQVCGVYALD